MHQATSPIFLFASLIRLKLAKINIYFIVYTVNGRILETLFYFNLQATKKGMILWISISRVPVKRMSCLFDTMNKDFIGGNKMLSLDHIVISSSNIEEAARKF